MIGDLDNRITLETPVRTADSYGGATLTWSEIASVWARIEALSSRETTPREMRTHEIRYRITIRYRDDVTTDMRILHGAKQLLITGLRDPDEGHRWLVLDCVEGAAA